MTDSEELERWRVEAMRLDRMLKELVSCCRPKYFPREIRETVDTWLTVDGERVPAARDRVPL